MYVQLPAIEQWRGGSAQSVLQSVSAHNRYGGILRRYTGVQVAEREDRSILARQKNQATAEQFYMRYGGAVSLAFADALLEVIDAIPAPVDEGVLSLAAAQA